MTLTNRPTQAATIAWAETGDAINASLSNYAAPGGMVAAGRTNYADQVMKDVSAAGGTVLIYLDAIVINNWGRYHSLLFDASPYGPAVPQWGSYSANSTGVLADFRVGGVMLSKLEAVLELMVAENPHMGGWFADDVGSRSWFPNINWSTVPQVDKDAWRAGAIAVCQIFRRVADKYKLIFIVNGTWTANDGGGYPAVGTHGCSLADGGFVEHHDGQIAFFGPYATSTQWASASATTNGTSFMWAVMTTSAGQTEFVNSNAYAYVNNQPTADYDYVAPWGSFHATGLPSQVTHPSSGDALLLRSDLQPLRGYAVLRGGSFGSTVVTPPAPVVTVPSAGSNISFRLFNLDTGAYIGDLVDFTKVSCSFEYSGIGAFQCDYPLTGRFSSLITTDLEVVAYYNGVEVRNGRWVLRGQSGSTVDESGGKVQIAGLSFIDVLRKVILYTDTTFSAQTPGAIVRTLLQTAAARGAFGAAVITTTSFNNSTDSKGVAWAHTLTRTYERGTTYRQIMESLYGSGLTDFEMNGRDLRLYNGTTMGSNLDVVLAAGAYVTETPYKASTEDRANVVLVEGDNASFVERSTTGPRREEMYLQQSGISNVPTLSVIGDSILSRASVTTEQRTIKLAVASPVRALRDFSVGDFVILDDGQNAAESVRVRQITVEVDQDYAEQASVVLNDRILEYDIQQAIKLGAIAGGVGGGTIGTPAQPPTVDTTTPSAPASITYSSSTYMENSGIIRAQVTVGWPAVTTNTDGSAIDDLDRYELQYQGTATPSVPAGQWSQIVVVDANTTQTYFGPVIPAKSVTVRVRAMDSHGHPSAWTQGQPLTVVSDTTPPPAPGAPTVTPFFRGIRIVWNGLDLNGQALPADYDHVDVHYSTVNNFTPSPSTKADQLPTRGGVSPINDLTYGTTYYVKLVAVDTTGNQSTPSAQSSATPAQLVGPDFPGQVIQNAYIANLAVDDAKIASLSVGKLVTGTLTADVILGARIRTATSGNRVDISGIGMEMYRGTFRTVWIRPDVGQIRVYNDVDATLTSTGHGFQAGDDNGTNLIIDNNEIMARNGGAASLLLLNKESGAVYIGNNTLYPSNPYTTGAARFNNDSAYITVPVRIWAGSDVSPTNENPPLLIGDSGGGHIQIDSNEIMAVSGDVVAPIMINASGSTVGIGGNLEVLQFGSRAFMRCRFGPTTYDSSLQLGDTTVYVRDYTGSNTRDLSCRTLFQTSGRQTKADIVDISSQDPLPVLGNVPIYSYTLLDDPIAAIHDNDKKGVTAGRKQIGPMAEDLAAAYPDLVSTLDGQLHVNMASMLGMLFLAGKRLRAGLMGLNTRTTALEADVADLKAKVGP